jgi:hypothetical protein
MARRSWWASTSRPDQRPDDGTSERDWSRERSLARQSRSARRRTPIGRVDSTDNLELPNSLGKFTRSRIAGVYPDLAGSAGNVGEHFGLDI